MLTAPGSGSGTVTVQSGDDDYPVMPDQVLDVANSYLMLMSNGVRFLILTADDVQGTNTVITASAGGATSLSVDQQNVGVTKFSSGTHTITLPAVATCVGRIYTITALGTGAGTVTVDTQDDDVPVLVDHVLSAQNSYVVLVSDGVRFFLVDSGGDTAIKAIVCTDGGATQLLLEEQYVTCTAPDGTTHTITLPAVATCMGRIYSIFCTSNDTGTVTIASDGLSDVVLTTTSDNLIVLSDGVRFHVLLEVST
jgi:NADPH-dependent ferric siderophore reductase